MSDRDLVWVRGTAEANFGAIDPVEVYESYPRAEWDAMTEEQRSAEIDTIGQAALEQIAGYGASVVDPSEVSAAVRSRAEAEQ